MSDIKEPFCPVPPNTLFFDLKVKDLYLDIIIEKISNFYNSYNSTKNNFIKSTAILSSIKSALEVYITLNNNNNSKDNCYKNIILFSCNKDNDINCPKEEKKETFQDFYGSINEIKLFLPIVIIKHII
jgi:hypothetical protein